MSEQNIKVGDRVRAACGESVIIGLVTGLHPPEDVQVQPDGYTQSNLLNYAGWTIEVIAPPIPDVVGTIVRDKDGDAWQRRTFGWYLADQDDRLYSLESLRRLAPFTVLWTPEP